MQSKFITVDSVSLAYIEKNAQAGKTIFFIHGNSSSHHTWRQQLCSSLLSHYRLIAFDLPAHGLSDAALDTTCGYSLPGIAGIMAKAVQQLTDEKPYLLAGFSLGTNIISEMLSYYVQPKGIVLVSSCAISTIDDLKKVFLPNPNAGMFFQDEINMVGLKRLVWDAFFTRNPADLERCIEDFISTKVPFRSLLIKNSMAGKVTDEIASLRRLVVPLLVIFGRDEKNVNPDHMDGMDLFFWRNNIFKLPEASHFVHVDQSAVFNHLLTEYAADCFKQIRS